MNSNLVSANHRKERITFEIMLLIVTLGMTYLVYRMGGYKMVALNLFYLPIVLSGYYNGRTNAGILAVFCALAVTVATTLRPDGFSAYSSPVMIGLALTVWASVLGLTAILVGTLCDERAKKVDELHEAYIGVVEVLSKYLQSCDPHVKARCVRVAELCQEIASMMRLSRKEVDDIRVAALLHDLGSMEITTRMLSRAMDTIETSPGAGDENTFMGTDMVHSLGSVLHGAFPLLVKPDDMDPLDQHRDASARSAVPLGAKIITASRAYDRLANSDLGEQVRTPEQAFAVLQNDASGEYAPEVLEALKTLVDNKRTRPDRRRPVSAM